MVVAAAIKAQAGVMAVDVAWQRSKKGVYVNPTMHRERKPAIQIRDTGDHAEEVTWQEVISHLWILYQVQAVVGGFCTEF